MGQHQEEKHAKLTPRIFDPHPQKQLYLLSNHRIIESIVVGSTSQRCKNSPNQEPRNLRDRKISLSRQR